MSESTSVLDSLNNQTDLIQISGENAKKVAEQLVEELEREQLQLSKHIHNQNFKIIFDILISISYILLSLGSLLTIEGGVANNQKLITFLTSPENQTFIIILSSIAILISKGMDKISMDKNMKPKQRRTYDCILDFSRGILYILGFIFLKPFVYSNKQDSILFASFWIYLLALILFLARKILKWIYFCGEGKQILTPWILPDANLAKCAKLIRALFKLSSNNKNGEVL